MNAQPEFNLSDPEQPDSIEGYFPEIAERLSKLKTQGAFVAGFKHHGPWQPALWTYSLFWPGSFVTPTTKSDP